MPCKFEGEMVRAQHSGTWTSGLLRHQEACADCREVLRLMQTLHQDAIGLAADCVPLPAKRVWLEAEQRRRKTALARAAISVRVLKTSGLVYALFFALWAVHALLGTRSGFSLPRLDGKAVNASLEGIALAALCIGMGLVYALRRDRLPAD